jgi:hypothetical protein
MTTGCTSRWLIAVALLLALLALLVLWPTVALAAPPVQEEPAPAGQLSPELIVSTLAGALAIALEVVPGLRKRWDSLSWESKRFLWLAGCLALGFAPPALACLGRLLGLDLSGLTFVTTCDVDRVWPEADRWPSPRSSPRRPPRDSPRPGPGPSTTCATTASEPPHHTPSAYPERSTQPWPTK